MKKILFVALLSFSSLFSIEVNIKEPTKSWISYESSMEEAEEERNNKNVFRQWFIGPLLVPSPITLNPKHPVFEPSVTLVKDYGEYGSNWAYSEYNDKVWSVQYLAYWQMGLTKHLGIDVYGTLASNYTAGASSTYFMDTIFRLGYQITRHQPGTWIPNFRVLLQESFPTGNYQKLQPRKKGTDLTGEGSFQTGLYLAAEMPFGSRTMHTFNLYGAVGYLVQSSARVHGVNFYGGNKTAKGRVYPGNIVAVYLSGELELTKHLAFAFDSNYQQNFSGKFRGWQGSGAKTDVFQIVTFSLAPEIEIAFSEKTGLLLGSWFTLAGQNSPSFIGYFLSFFWEL